MGADNMNKKSWSYGENGVSSIIKFKQIKYDRRN